MGFSDRMRQAWNAFRKASPAPEIEMLGPSTTSYVNQSSSRLRFTAADGRTIISSIYTRIAIDVAQIAFRHVKLDDQGRYQDEIHSNLNSCLNLEANLDQGPRSFRQDIVMTLFDKGCAALVPVDTTVDPTTNEVIDILTLRVGEVVHFYPKHVKLSVYNEATGKREDITLEKRFVAIVDNPLYPVINAPNSTLQRLLRKLGLLDVVDEASSSGKLDLIIQLPYVVKSEARRVQAEQRRSDLEFQLKGSEYGVAYTDGTEKIVQLNRPAENNLMAQVEYLVKLLYSQLGLTEAVMDGTADEAAMINYYNRTVEPILDSTAEAMQRAFLGHQGTADLEKITYFRDPFKLIPIKDLAEIADKFTRNEIASSNEIRGKIGMAPSKDPKADQLVNSNMPQPATPPAPGVPDSAAPPAPPAAPAGPKIEDIDSIMNEVFDGLSSQVDDLTKQLSSG